MIKKVRSEPDRIYETIGNTELRFGKFNDPNAHFNGDKFELRITSPDPEFVAVVFEKTKDWMTN